MAFFQESSKKIYGEFYKKIILCAHKNSIKTIYFLLASKGKYFKRGKYAFFGFFKV